MKIKYVMVFGASAAGMVGSAQAAPVFPHLELLAGYDNAKLNGTSGNGLTYTVQAGVDVPVSQRVFVGIEGNYSISKSSKSGSGYFPQYEETVKEKVSTPHSVYVGARLGFEPVDHLQFYLKGGYRFNTGRDKYTGYGPQNTETESLKLQETKGGISGGAGFQWFFSKRVYAKVEGTYTKEDFKNAGLKGRDIKAVAGFGVQLGPWGR